MSVLVLGMDVGITYPYSAVVIQLYQCGDGLSLKLTL